MMKEQSIDSGFSAWATAVGVAAVLNALLVIIKTSVPAVKTTMSLGFGSSWVIHALIVLVVFFGSGIFLSILKPQWHPKRIVYQMAGAVILSTGAIFVCYLYHLLS